MEFFGYNEDYPTGEKVGGFKENADITALERKDIYGKDNTFDTR